MPFPDILKIGFSTDEKKLWALNLPVEEILISEIAYNLDIPYLEQEGTDDWNLTPRMLIENYDKEVYHAGVIDACDVSYPIEIFFHNEKRIILDGVHRFTKVIMSGLPTIKVRRVMKDHIPLIQKNVYSLEIFLQDSYDVDTIKYRINIFNKVMNYTYQINGAKTIEKLLELQSGYCAPKARLLQAAYNKLGYETKLCFVPFTFDILPLPEKLMDRGLADKKGYHTFIKLLVGDNWIDIDATFHPALKKWFHVNDTRDGISSQKVIYPYKEVYIPQTPEEEYEIKSKLNDPNGWDKKDEEWVEEFNNWVTNQI